jgi:CelD/BcsL family acetyltransferase involved in cellulose biosynthesis
VDLAFHELSSPDEFASLSQEWDALAVRSGSPFLDSAWVLAWWRAFDADERAFLLVGGGGDGVLRSGAFLTRRPDGGLAAAVNVHSADWDVVADGDAARAACWREITQRAGRRLQLTPLPDSVAREAREALTAAGFAVVARSDDANPRLGLPSTWDELAAAANMKPRSTLGRSTRALRAAGEVSFRTVRGGPTLEQDLAAFFELEAAGWKGQAGTAINCDPRTVTLYGEYARRAATTGSLRLHLLHFDGTLLAAGLGCAYAGGAFLMKSAYDEDQGRYSPGLLLRAEILRSAIDEGCTFFDFLGSPAPHKLRWGAVPVTRWTVDGYRGLTRPIATYRNRLRPRLTSARDLVLRRG